MVGSTIGNINNASCLCKRINYYTDSKGDCLTCPEGADCSDHDGITLAELGTQPGYWRINASTTEFADCARDLFACDYDKKYITMIVTSQRLVAALNQCEQSNDGRDLKTAVSGSWAGLSVAALAHVLNQKLRSR